MSVLSMASTINLTARRNTVSAIKARAVNDPWAAVNPALPIVSVADQGVRIAGAPARAATAPTGESR